MNFPAFEISALDKQLYAFLNLADVHAKQLSRFNIRAI